MNGKWIGVFVGMAALLAGCGGGDDNPAGSGDPPETVKILSISPADGSSQVGEDVEIRIEFDRPVDLVGAIMVPDLRWMDEEWLQRSDDGTTYSRVIALEDNTVYQLIVFGAMGSDSTYLDEPQMVSFTTSDVLPQGSISGVVETPNSYTAEGTVLLLVDATHWLPQYGFGSANDPEQYMVAFGFVPDKTGAYKIEHVRNGNYYLYAFKDAGADGLVEDEKDLFGFYNITTGMQAINVSGGQETPGIDFPVFQGNSFFRD